MKAPIYFLGDIHGNFKTAIKCAKKRANSTIIQVGDFGVGFLNKKGELEKLPEFPENLKFIRGNHDNPLICNELNNYLGNFGLIQISGYNIFYISGAASHDKEYRTEYIDWWADEELNFAQIYECLDLYEKHKDSIDIIASHDCPAIFAKTYLGIKDDSKTRDFLEQIFNIKNPPYWYFGHHHKYVREKMGDTEFRCLNIDQLQGFPINMR